MSDRRQFLDRSNERFVQFPDIPDEVKKDPDWCVYTKAEIGMMIHSAVTTAGFATEPHRHLLQRAVRIISCHHSNEEMGDGGKWLRDYEDHEYGGEG